MAILHCNLITAFSCRVDGRKNIVTINGNRFNGGFVIETMPTTMVVEFREPCRWLDITMENIGYTGELKAEGLGVNIANIMPLLPKLNKFTYRLNLPEQVKGKITFTATGGKGKLTIFNVSGFEEVK
jgi:hypothetical protein